MGNQKMPGLFKRGEFWHIDKVFGGTRICESTQTSDFAKAQEQLAKRIDQIRSARVYGLRLDRSFRMAATKFLEENRHKRTIDDDARLLKQLDPFIGDLMLRQVHMGGLQPFIAQRRQDGVKTRSINLALAVVRRIVNLAASEWRDSEQGLTWLEHAPKIKLLPVRDGRTPYPLSREEQAMLLQELPDYLVRMALFKVNTGCREQEVCGLRWDDEVKVPELDTSVFIISGDKVKNEEDRVVVLNRIARSVVDSQRGLDSVHAFVYTPKPRKAKHGGAPEDVKPRRLASMNNTAWKNGRIRAADKWKETSGEEAPAGFRKVRVHDLKHTFGRRLRAAGVSFEDRQDLLGHKSGRITTHYSAAELANLIAAAEKVCEDGSRKSPAITVLRRKVS
jgi:integrase